MGNIQEEQCLTLGLRTLLMREMAAEGGRSTSRAKKQAARRNIRKFWKKVKRGEVRHPITKKFVNGKTKNHAKG